MIWIYIRKPQSSIWQWFWSSTMFLLCTRHPQISVPFMQLQWCLNYRVCSSYSTAWTQTTQQITKKQREGNSVFNISPWYLAPLFRYCILSTQLQEISTLSHMVWVTAHTAHVINKPHKNPQLRTRGQLSICRGSLSWHHCVSDTHNTGFVVSVHGCRWFLHYCMCHIFIR